VNHLEAPVAEQWKPFGVHAGRGEENTESIAQMMAGHDINRIGQIQAIFIPKKK
jgi:hypothetical protein